MSNLNPDWVDAKKWRDKVIMSHCPCWDWDEHTFYRCFLHAHLDRNGDVIDEDTPTS